MYSFSSPSNCGNGHADALHEVFILFLADKLASGKKLHAELSVLEVIAQFFVAGIQSYAVRFRDQRFFIDQLLRCLAGKKGHQRARLRGRALALNHEPALRAALPAP